MKRNKLKPPLKFSKLTIAVFAAIVGFYSIISIDSNPPKVSSSSKKSSPPEELLSISPIKEVDSLAKLIKSRPKHIALIRCDSSENEINSDIANWSICGLVGAVPKYDQRISWNPNWSLKFVDDNGTSHKSQDWELMLLNLDQNTAQNTLTDVQQTLSQWQQENPWIRNIEQQELSKYSPILHRFYTSIGQQVEDIGNSPWNSSKAYIDRRILNVQHGEPLFEANGELIELAPLETGKSSYTPVHYPIPKSLYAYNNPYRLSLHPETPCKGASRQALLVHEPHQQLEGETAFFFLFAYLQEQYPATFGELHIFQEGQPNNLNASDSVFNLPEDGFDDEIIEMLENSYNSWNSSFYAPLNGNLNSLKDAILSFLVTKNLPTEGVWDESVDFYKFREKSGALDTRSAVKANLSDRTDDREKTQKYLNRLETLEVNDAVFAETLVEQNRFRGALAYELFVEGNTSPTSGKSVTIHGLDDAGIYYASCALSSGCMGSSVDSKSHSYSGWKRIQPFRDWVMARTVVQGLESLDQDVVPVVAAAAGTHLPLVREFLCEAGIGTVTLASSAPYANGINGLIKAGVLKGDPLEPMKLWQPPQNWHGTTPISTFFTSRLSSLPSPGISSINHTGSGILQTLDTWITNPGLF